MASITKAKVEWDQVVYTWLRHEYNARPEVKKMCRDASAVNLILHPDFSRGEDALARLGILRGFRNYLSEGYFTKRDWYLEVFNQDCLKNFILPLKTGWMHISGGSYRPEDAARRILSESALIDPKFGHSIAYITENYLKLSEMNDRFIVVGNNHLKLEVIEGAHRLVSVFYRKLKEPDFQIREREVYVGINKEIE